MVRTTSESGRSLKRKWRLSRNSRHAPSNLTGTRKLLRTLAMVTISAIRPLLWPCPTSARAGFGTLDPDWFDGQYLILWVNPNEYRRVVERPGDAKPYTDTSFGVVSPAWTARVGFDATISDGDARKMLLIHRALELSQSSDITVLDFVRPEVSDVISQAGYTSRLGRVEAIEEKGGMVQDSSGILYCPGFDIRFREKARRLKNS